MLPEFNYKRPRTVKEALGGLAAGSCNIIAGGTDMIVELRKKKNIDFDILDISAVSELRFIKKENGRIVIGSLSTFSDIFNSQLVQEEATLLKEAVRNAGSLQIRNRGTVGGNICNASPAADSVPALTALSAEVKLVGAAGERELMLDSFITGPYSTAIKPGEILKSISFKPPDCTGYYFYKLGRREALAISRMNVAVMLKLKSGIIKNAVISPGSVMPSPGRVTEAEDLLKDKKASEELFKKAARKVSDIMIEKSGIRWSTEYKKPVIEEMVNRALIFAAGMKE